jgi:hypothetical protein
LITPGYVDVGVARAQGMRDERNVTYWQVLIAQLCAAKLDRFCAGHYLYRYDKHNDCDAEEVPSPQRRQASS